MNTTHLSLRLRVVYLSLGVGDMFITILCDVVCSILPSFFCKALDEAIQSLLGWPLPACLGSSLSRGAGVQSL